MSEDKHKESTKNESAAQDPSRRRFVKNTSMVVGGVAGGSLLGGLLTKGFGSEEAVAPAKEEEKPTYNKARMFFTRYADFVVLAQATERIFPKDDNGPGAIDLDVPYFIDKQLAGEWGMNGKDYRQGPFTNESAEEASLNRGEIFINGLRKMNQVSQKKFDTTFDEANEDQQIEILEELEDDKIDIKGIQSSSFFTLLREATLEGAYSDPLYGGNKDMAGWKMKEYPGPVTSYADMIEDEEFVKMDPVSLTDYQQN